MRYIGGKSQLLNDIDEIIQLNTHDVSTILDIFAGTGVVSNRFKDNGYRVISNDFLYFSYVIQKCHIEINRVPDFSKLGNNPIDILNNLDIKNTNINIENCFIYYNYSLAHSDRMYFQVQNALKIDIIRITIEDWYKSGLIDEQGYYYLLCSLIEAVPFVANITGVYSAYLKHWDARTYNPIILKAPLIVNNERSNKALNLNYDEALKYRCDLLYADPPYNSREYLPNYHILETIARYDYPVIYGVTGMRDYSEQKSDFCKKAKVEKAFEKLINSCNAKYVLISYNNEGLIETECLAEICRKYAVKNTFVLKELPYRRYKSKIPNNKQGLKEQLYFLEKDGS